MSHSLFEIAKKHLIEEDRELYNGSQVYSVRTSFSGN